MIKIQLIQEWLKIGIIQQKTGFMKKKKSIGYYYTSFFRFDDPLFLSEVIGQMKRITVELERDMELIGAGDLVKKERNRWEKKIEPILRKHHLTCKTIEENHSEYPEETMKELQSIHVKKTALKSKNIEKEIDKLLLKK